MWDNNRNHTIRAFVQMEISYVEYMWTIQTDIVNWTIRINIEFHESIVMFCVLCELTRTKPKWNRQKPQTHTNPIDWLMHQFLAFESLIWEAFVFCKYLQINWSKWSYSFVHHQTLCRECARAHVHESNWRTSGIVNYAPLSGCLWACFLDNIHTHRDREKHTSILKLANAFLATLPNE